MRPFYCIAFAFVLTLGGCAKTSAIYFFPEHVQSSTCYSGDFAFIAFVDVPENYGNVLAMTQHVQSDTELTPVCRLDLGEDFNGFTSYLIYDGEIENGDAGFCVSARTTRAGHVMSCASEAAVQRTLRATPTDIGRTITLEHWQPYSAD